VSRPKQHPGATGVAPWIPWNLTEAQRADLQEWLRSLKIERIDETGFIGAIEEHVRLYLLLKALAKESSAGPVRRNLRAAEKAAHKLVFWLNCLDGNSLQILSRLTHRGSVRADALAIHRNLLLALSHASTEYPNGARPKQERDALAALLADALRTHTSARPTATKGGIFDQLLQRAFGLAGERRGDLHTLAERVLKRHLISRPQDGLLSIDTYREPQK
jgi:hypothetical protein